MNRLLLFSLSTIMTLLLTMTETAAYTATIYQDCEHGNGRAKTESRVMPEFNLLEASGAFEIRVVAGQNKQTVKVTADENILPLIATVLQGNKLVIYPEKPICTDMDIIVEITMGSLVALVSSGSDNVKVQGLNNRKFSMVMSGSSDVELSGNSFTLDADISGAGDLDARSLKTKETILNISGTGTANVHATEKLKVSIVGVADVNYFGNPKQIEKEIIGVGNINQME